MIEEDHKIAKIRGEATKQRIARRYNKNVLAREFKEEDLVLRKVELQRKSQEEGKLALN